MIRVSSISAYQLSPARGRCLSGRGDFLLFLLSFLPTFLFAQGFTVLDADSHEPLPGVYVFGEKGSLLTMSDENGFVKALNEKVTLSMMSFESQTVDARTFQGEVLLKAKPYELSEVVIGKNDYMKISATFRDVVKNFDGVVVYREGLVDFYYDLKSKKYKRRVRACRQYEHEDLRNYNNDSIHVWSIPLFDFSKVRQLQTADSASVHGDTTFVAAMKGKTLIEDGVMCFKNNGLYRVVIDSFKFTDKNSASFLGLHYRVTKHIVDWTYNDPSCSNSSLVAVRRYWEEELQWSKKSPVVPIQTQSDFVVNSVTCITKDEAKAEMKDKEITTEFTLPDCLPALPESVLSQVNGLVLRKFRER